jgi:hypothetical protein
VFGFRCWVFGVRFWALELSRQIALCPWGCRAEPFAGTARLPTAPAIHLGSRAASLLNETNLNETHRCSAVRQPRVCGTGSPHTVRGAGPGSRPRVRAGHGRGSQCDAMLQTAFGQGDEFDRTTIMAVPAIAGHRGTRATLTRGPRATLTRRARATLSRGACATVCSSHAGRHQEHAPTGWPPPPEGGVPGPAWCALRAGAAWYPRATARKGRGHTSPRSDSERHGGIATAIPYLDCRPGPHRRTGSGFATAIPNISSPGRLRPYSDVRFR